MHGQQDKLWPPGVLWKSSRIKGILVVIRSRTESEHRINVTSKHAKAMDPNQKDIAFLSNAGRLKEDHRTLNKAGGLKEDHRTLEQSGRIKGRTSKT